MWTPVNMVEGRFKCNTKLEAICHSKTTKPNGSIFLMPLCQTGNSHIPRDQPTTLYRIWLFRIAIRVLGLSFLTS